ncbi:MAG: hypothetical protein AMXMBFR84_51360 [Candidatus Hydrogenedentota bacterium]
MDPKTLEWTVAKTTHQYRSEGERRIATTLDNYGIPYVYEPILTITTSGTTKRLCPDFLLPNEEIIVEYFGRITNQNYDQRMRSKMKLYDDNKIEVIPIYPITLLDHWPRPLLDPIYKRQQEYAQAFRRATATPRTQLYSARTYAAVQHQYQPRTFDTLPKGPKAGYR